MEQTNVAEGSAGDSAQEESCRVHLVSQQESEGTSQNATKTPEKRSQGMSSSAPGTRMSQDSVASWNECPQESPFKRLRRAVQAVTPSPMTTQPGTAASTRTTTNTGESVGSTERVRLAFAVLRPRSLIKSFSEGIDECDDNDDTIEDNKEREMLKMWMTSLCRKMEQYLRKVYEGKKIYVSPRMALKELIETGRKVSVPLSFIEAMHEIRFMGEIAKYTSGSFPSKDQVESKVRTYQNAKQAFDAKMRGTKIGGHSQFV